MMISKTHNYIGLIAPGHGGATISLIDVATADTEGHKCSISKPLYGAENESETCVIIPAMYGGSGGFMGLLHSVAVRLLLSGLLFAGLCGAAFAAGPHDRTQFGHDISVGTDEEAAGVTCYKRGSRAHRG